MLNGTRYFGTLNGKNGVPLAASESHAKDIAGGIRQSVREGTYKRKGETTEKGCTRNFAKFFDEVYLPYAKENKSSWKHDEFRGEALKEVFGERTLAEIKPLLVASFINHRLKTTTKRGTFRDPTTVHKEVQLLSSIFNMAIREGITEGNPCRNIPKATKEKIRPWNKRKRQLTLD